MYNVKIYKNKFFIYCQSTKPTDIYKKIDVDFQNFFLKREYNQ